MKAVTNCGRPSRRGLWQAYPSRIVASLAVTDCGRLIPSRIVALSRHGLWQAYPSRIVALSRHGLWQAYPSRIVASLAVTDCGRLIRHGLWKA